MHQPRKKLLNDAVSTTEAMRRGGILGFECRSVLRGVVPLCGVQMCGGGGSCTPEHCAPSFAGRRSPQSALWRQATCCSSHWPSSSRHHPLPLRTRRYVSMAEGLCPSNSYQSALRGAAMKTSVHAGLHVSRHTDALFNFDLKQDHQGLELIERDKF